MYDSILLPIDGSPGATEALHHAGEIAHGMDATINLLFVADTTRDSVTVVETDLVDALVNKGETIVADAAETLQTLGVEYTTDVVQGTPAPTIVEYAKRYDHDLVVMPTHGHTGLARYLLGSVTEKVVRLSSVPVLTVRMESDESMTFPYERILLPTDGSPRAVSAARHGVDLAVSLDATVYVLSAINDQSLGPDIRSTVAEDELVADAESAVEEIVTVAEQQGVSEIHQQIVHGRPAAVISDAIEQNDIDAVVMGTTGRRGIDRILLGSVAEKTVRSATVPVITVAGE